MNREEVRTELGCPSVSPEKLDAGRKAQAGTILGKGGERGVLRLCPRPLTKEELDASLDGRARPASPSWRWW